MTVATRAAVLRDGGMNRRMRYAPIHVQTMPMIRQISDFSSVLRFSSLSFKFVMRYLLVESYLRAVNFYYFRKETTR